MATKKFDKRGSFRHAQQIIYVIVGPEKQKFGIHKDHLCATSPYFKAAFEGIFQEADLGEVTMEDISVVAFEMFNEWLYTGEITEELCQQDVLNKPTYHQLLDVWVLGGYLLVPQLQNYVADMIIAKREREMIIPTQHFAYFYEKTRSGSLMRKLMVDIFVWKWYNKSALYRQNINNIPFEMNMDLLIAFARRLNKEDENPFKIKGHYHVPVKDSSTTS